MAHLDPRFSIRTLQEGGTVPADLRTSDGNGHATPTDV
jgi:hypothetical protein